jgi:hypothetical protein
MTNLRQHAHGCQQKQLCLISDRTIGLSVDVEDVIAIPLSRGMTAYVDAEDAERVLAVGKWTAQEGGYRWYAVNRKGGVTTFMHRLILGITNCSVQVDHRDLDGLNCRRNNLRVATNSQNGANRCKIKVGTSPFKGVDLHAGKWRARVKKDGQQVTLGHFGAEQAAALAYDAAARRPHGRFARLNFPIGVESAA